jgi:hypothetical protein
MPIKLSAAADVELRRIENRNTNLLRITVRYSSMQRYARLRSEDSQRRWVGGGRMASLLLVYFSLIKM